MPPRAHPQAEVEAPIRVRVQPRAKREGIDGGPAGSWRLRVAAPPVDGEANRAVIALLARALGVRRAELSIVGGARGRDKLIRVEGMPADEIARRLAEAAADSRR